MIGRARQTAGRVRPRPALSSIPLRNLRFCIVVLAIALCSVHEAAAQTLTLSLFERYLESLRVQAGIPGMSGAVSARPIANDDKGRIGGCDSVVIPFP